MCQLFQLLTTSHFPIQLYLEWLFEVTVSLLCDLFDGVCYDVIATDVQHQHRVDGIDGWNKQRSQVTTVNLIHSSLE